jgi:hypothetical protein
MNLNPTNPLTPEEILAKLKEMQNFFLKTAIPENINSSSSQTAPHRIYRSRINQLHKKPNPQPETHPLKRIDKGQLDNPNFFSKFSASFNLMEPFIKAQSANDLVIALCSLGNNLKFDFQKERSIEMLKHLNSNEGRIFLKHKIDRIINDTTEQILRDPHLNSSNSGNKGSSTDDDLTKSEGNIATKNDLITH